jgi:glucose-6-phosphate isomerase
MKLTKNINFRNFNIKKPKKKIANLLKELLNNNYSVIDSMRNSYKDSFTKKNISKYKKYSNIVLIGMGGSILGAKAIYNFLEHKIKKNFYFIDNFDEDKIRKVPSKKNLNLIISKSGNTLETIVNSNILLKRQQTNLFLTENNHNYLRKLAENLKSEIIDHNNFIGGRYSVLSEVGMVPAYFMGLNINNFRKFNDLIKNKNFINSLIKNVSQILNLNKKKKFNSIILNYDDRSIDLFYWYQQLVAESLGKKSKGILPVVSSMPRDNHSLMQFYLDGKKNNFYTFFNVINDASCKINSNKLLRQLNYLNNKKIENIKDAQFIATQNIFKKKKIPFRTFNIKKRSEETLGELFVFFILETILLGKALNVNPFDQPSVELIKNETKKILIKS